MLSNKKIRGNVFEITQQLAGIDYGEHVILIYPNLDSLRQIYSQYCRDALENNELVLLLTYYETTDRVRQTLKEIGIEVDRHEKGKNLMIIEDITKTYFGSGHDFLFFLDILNKQKEKRGKNGMCVIADMGIFYHFTDNNKDALIEFERSLPSKFDINLKRICNYHKLDFDRLEEQEKHKLLEHHSLQMRVLPHMIAE
jgi:hypothetical protein